MNLRCAVALTGFIVCVSGPSVTIAGDNTLDSRADGYYRESQCKPRDVTIKELIAKPESYHGICVRIGGYLNVEFEGNCIYPSKLDLKRFLRKNGLWVSLPPRGGGSALRLSAESNNGQHVLIEGLFNAKHRGHGSLWGGAIENITRLEKWR